MSFMVTGTVHILSISGLHVALLAAGLFAIARLLRLPRGATLGLVAVATVISTAITEGLAHVNNSGLGAAPGGNNTAWIKGTKGTLDDGEWWEHVDDDGNNQSGGGGGGGGVGGGGGGWNKSLTPEEVEQLSYALSDAYLPIWFDRSTGWTGNTYDEALEFCDSHDDFVPCPYEV